LDLQETHWFVYEQRSMVIRHSLMILVGIGFSFLGLWDDRAIGQVATVADAKQVLDLEVFPALDPVGPVEATIALQSYRAKGDAEKIARKVDAALVKHGLTQVDGAMFTPAYCSATYGKERFHFVLTVLPGEPGIAKVSLANLGNVDFRDLPIAKLGKEVFVQPASAIFQSQTGIAETQQACRDLLAKDGWEWFGDTAASFYMRKNAVRLQVACSESPREKGQTMIQVSAEQMSSALPIVSGLVRINYTEITGRLDGDSKLAPADLATRLRQALELAGWTATTQEPLKIKFKQHFVFRNPADEMVDLAFYPFDALSRFEMKYLTAKQVAAENERADSLAETAKARMESDKNRANHPIVIPIESIEGATLKDSRPQVLEFAVPAGQARAVVAKWIAKSKAGGWSVETMIDSIETGKHALALGDKKVDITFIDPGFIPAEVTIRTTSGHKLEVSQ
jgi:hypothetical protein